MWANIHRAGVPYHPIYDLGMRRLSCALCPLAARADIVRSCQLLPANAARYLTLEDDLGVPFRPGLSLHDAYTEAVATAGPDDPIRTGRPLPLAQPGRWPG